MKNVTLQHYSETQQPERPPSNIKIEIDSIIAPSIPNVLDRNRYNKVPVKPNHNTIIA